MLHYAKLASSKPCGLKAEFVLLIHSSGELRVKPGARPNGKLGRSRGLLFRNTGNNILNGKPLRSGSTPLRKRNIRLLTGCGAWSSVAAGASNLRRAQSSGSAWTPGSTKRFSPNPIGKAGCARSVSLPRETWPMHETGHIGGTASGNGQCGARLLTHHSMNGKPPQKSVLAKSWIRVDCARSERH